MRNGGVKYFLLALIFGILAALGSFIYLNSQKSETKAVDLINVPVASKAIEAYALLNPSQFVMKSFPKNSIHPDTLLSIDEISGKYATTDIMEGEQILSARIRESIDDVLPSVIQDGYRAISLLTNEFQAVGDILHPGDYVDLIVFLPEKTRQEVVIREDQAQLFIEAVKVLAVSRETLNGSTAHEEVPDRYSVTLEVPVELTKDIVLAENIGVIEIVLRGENDNGRLNTPPIFWEDLQ